MSKELALVDKARKALAEAQSIHEVTEVRDQAKALADYLKTREGAEEAASRATEIRLRAERRIGEMTKAMPKAEAGGTHDGKPGGSRCLEGAPRKRDALARAGIDHRTASQYERMAAVDPEVFEAAVKQPKASTAGIVRLARNKKSKPHKRRKPPTGSDPRLPWLESVVKQAGVEARRIKNDPFNQGITELGRRASVLAKAIQTAARANGAKA